jgi:glycogen(starch) synthase
LTRPRLLAVSNYYPPHHVGGYELGCADVLARLRERGYHVEVLTSMRGVSAPESGDGVHRWLELEYAKNQASRPRRLAYLLERELKSRRAFDRALALVKPDLVYAFNVRDVAISMLFRAERRGLPVHYFVSDDWLAHWERDLYHRLSRSRRELDLSRTQFVSEYLKVSALAAGKRVAAGRVIPWGIEFERYVPRPAGPNRSRLLFAGQLAAHKGLHTAIEALAILKRQRPESLPQLGLAGRFLDAAYEARIRADIARHGLGDAVQFLGIVPRERLAAVFAEYDVFVFGSVWEEPFSIVLLEAMAAGLAVVATATGGSPEILRHRENSLVFPKEDAAACAAHLGELAADGELFERLGRRGRELVRERYQLTHMVDQLERALER